VRAILTNPKYTGYMVWNRRGRSTKRGHHNPAELWVWSEQPTHPALVTPEVFSSVADLAEDRRGSRSGSGSNAHPATKRTYLLRSYIHCAICRRRMEGSTRKNTFVYYRCRPGPTSGAAGHLQWPGHPQSFYVPEDKLVGGILGFLADRVLGAHRRDLLAVDLNETTDDVAAAWQGQLTAIERTLTDFDGRRSRLLQALETTDDPSGALAHDVNRRLTQIAHEQTVKRAELQRLRNDPPEEEDCAHLLDHLVQATAGELGQAPDAMLRHLFEACALTVHYDPQTLKTT
jgi:hypothetical protein